MEVNMIGLFTEKQKERVILGFILKMLSKNSIIHSQVNQALRTEQFSRVYNLLSVRYGLSDALAKLK
ncbi:hypothetical protein H5410_043440 [Solanum commersonii]|uniref:Uncharacterized protein n=1 Tax=Solanum commersonii TaxID=4109 RepID=A0A9J5Y1E5_SOLCO|nr:hypothetical protein H5410_043440 [Solanum commersonii]